MRIELNEAKHHLTSISRERNNLPEITEGKKESNYVV